MSWVSIGSDLSHKSNRIVTLSSKYSFRIFLQLRFETPLTSMRSNFHLACACFWTHIWCSWSFRQWWLLPFYSSLIVTLYRIAWTNWFPTCKIIATLWSMLYDSETACSLFWFLLLDRIRTAHQGVSVVWVVSKHNAIYTLTTLKCWEDAVLYFVKLSLGMMQITVWRKRLLQLWEMRSGKITFGLWLDFGDTEGVTKKVRAIMVTDLTMSWSTICRVEC